MKGVGFCQASPDSIHLPILEFWDFPCGLVILLGGLLDL